MVKLLYQYSTGGVFRQHTVGANALDIAEAKGNKGVIAELASLKNQTDASNVNKDWLQSQLASYPTFSAYFTLRA